MLGKTYSHRLARSIVRPLIGDMMSEAGHRYDYMADVAVNSLIFAAAGLGARHAAWGPAFVACGALATGSMVICWMLGQKLEGSGAKAYVGRSGFDLDDGLYSWHPSPPSSATSSSA
jgi:archaetidylinositol phosphate synthase